MDDPVPDAAHPRAAKAPAEPTCYDVERGARVNDRISRHAIHQHDAARVAAVKRGAVPIPSTLPRISRRQAPASDRP